VEHYHTVLFPQLQRQRYPHYNRAWTGGDVRAIDGNLADPLQRHFPIHGLHHSAHLPDNGFNLLRLQNTAHHLHSIQLWGRRAGDLLLPEDRDGRGETEGVGVKELLALILCAIIKCYLCAVI